MVIWFSSLAKQVGVSVRNKRNVCYHTWMGWKKMGRTEFMQKMKNEKKVVPHLKCEPVQCYWTQINLQNLNEHDLSVYGWYSGSKVVHLLIAGKRCVSIVLACCYWMREMSSSNEQCQRCHLWSAFTKKKWWNKKKWPKKRQQEIYIYKSGESVWENIHFQAEQMKTSHASSPCGV